MATKFSRKNQTKNKGHFIAGVKGRTGVNMGQTIKFLIRVLWLPKLVGRTFEQV